MSKLVLLAVMVVCAYAADQGTQTDVVINKCYQCESAQTDEADCAETEKLKGEWAKKCPSSPLGGNEPVVGCRKVVQEVEGEDRVVRECAFSGVDVDGLKRTGQKKIRIFYYQCSDKNQCNGADTLAVGVITSLLTLVAAVMIGGHFD